MLISVVTTLYYSSDYIEEFYIKITNALTNITNNFEIIFVNDGSPDNSLDIVLKLKKQDSRIKIIDLSRNFGHHKAIMTGLIESIGDFVFLIDSDLEEDPNLIKIFWNEIQESDFDVIYSIQKHRKGNYFEKISGFLFYKMFNFFSSIKIPESASTCRIMKRSYINELVKFREHELFITAILSATGFKQKGIYIDKFSSSPTTYSLRKKLDLMVNAITSFSSKPLVYVFYLGILISFFSFSYIIFIFIKKLVWNVPVLGWASLISSIWMIGGIIMLSLGIIGIYISKIFNEVKNRPYTVIKKRY